MLNYTAHSNCTGSTTGVPILQPNDQLCYEAIDGSFVYGVNITFLSFAAHCHVNGTVSYYSDDACKLSVYTSDAACSYWVGLEDYFDFCAPLK